MVVSFRSSCRRPGTNLSQSRADLRSKDFRNLNPETTNTCRNLFDNQEGRCCQQHPSWVRFLVYYYNSQWPKQSKSPHHEAAESYECLRRFVGIQQCPMDKEVFLSHPTTCSYYHERNQCLVTTICCPFYHWYETSNWIDQKNATAIFTTCRYLQSSRALPLSNNYGDDNGRKWWNRKWCHR